LSPAARDIGVLVVEERDRELYIARIEIRPDWQGRGIGSAVIRSLMQEAASSGRALTLDVLHGNDRARALYERLGFQSFAQNETHIFMRWRG
jgi:ribosomal protein S18 acetylase RimI-like enzyme